MLKLDIKSATLCCNSLSFNFRFPAIRLNRIFTAISFGIFLTVFLISTVCAQSGSGKDDQPSNKEGDVRFTVHATTATGLVMFVPDKWSLLPITVTNGKSEPQELLCSTYFGDDSTLQYGRRVWAPPHSILHLEQPVKVPKSDSAKIQSLELHSLVMDLSSDSRALLRNDVGNLRHDNTILVAKRIRSTAIISREPEYSIDTRDEVADLITACRVATDLTNEFTRIDELFMPADESGLEVFDHIVLADDRITNDFSGMTTLRRWLNNGGHLWVMMDRVKPETLSLLIGDEFRGYAVDRVSLTSFQVDETPNAADPKGRVGEPMNFDDPVELVQMVVDGFEVSHHVNGWPVAMTMTCGEGKLLVTTLGQRGWMKKHPDGTPRPNDPLKVSEFRPTSQMLNVADSILRLRQPELLTPNSVEPIVREYIGYKIPSWSVVVGTLIGFTIGILAVGFWLMRIGKLELLVWIGSVMAIAVTFFLIESGRANRMAVPPTIAIFQLIEAIRGTDEMRSDGVLAVYQPEGSQAEIKVSEGGHMIPDMTGMEQSSRRMVTTDLETNYWENLPQPPGVRSTSFERATTNPKRMSAYVTFDQQGLTGKIEGEVKSVTDAMVATREGRLALTIGSDGSFTGRGEDVLDKGQFLVASLLDDEQSRRRRTLKELLDNPKRRDYPSSPQLMFWSDSNANGFQFGEGLRLQGSSLYAIPIIIERPKTGTEIVVPSPFLSYVNRSNPDGSQSASLWNPATLEWQKKSGPGQTWLSIQVPPELLPLSSRRARLDLNVSGPIGKFELLGLDGANEINLHTVTNPVGTFSIDVSNPAALRINDDGLLYLGVRAGQTDEATGSGGGASGKANYWLIESLSVQLWAETTELPENR